MGLQKLNRGLLLCLLFFIACGDKEPVKPGRPIGVDPAAVELAEFALNAGVMSSYAFYRPGPLRPDTSLIDFRYTKEFLDSINLPVFRECYINTQGLGDSCFVSETTSYGRFSPAYWADAGNANDPDTLQFYIFPDSSQSLLPLSLDSMAFISVTYLGNFANRVILNDSFKTTRFAFRAFSLRDVCDTVEGAVKELRPGACLISGQLPDSGIFQKSWYYNPSRRSEIRRMSVWARTAGARVDSLARIGYYASDTLLEEFFCGNQYRVSSNTAALVKGVSLNDTAFQDTLFPGGRVFNGFRRRGGRFTLGTVLDSAGGTIFALSASPLEDTVKMDYAGGSAVFLRQGEALSLTDSAGARTAAATAAYGVLSLSFATADGLFSGEIAVNILTGKGGGALRNLRDGVTYSISVNTSGISHIEDIRL